jgi:hypothetical protein
MNIQLVLTILLSFSVFVNIVFFLYTRNILSKLLFISENISDLMEMVNRFVDHISDVNQMEMFYGDETLGHLMQHSQDLAEQFEMFEETIMLIEGDEELDNETDNEAEETPA